MSSQTRDNPSVEKALDELGRIIADMEAGRLGFEEAVARYARGHELIRHCRGVLEHAGERVTSLAPGGATSPERP